MSSAIICARCVTSSPAITTGRPDWKTISAASGSTKMLNSAEGVQFPRPIAPPMMTIRAILLCSSGWLFSSSATLVCGPVATRVTGSALSRSTFAISSTAVQLCGVKPGSGSAGPSSPLSPCTLSAIINSRIRGLRAPPATGISVRLSSVSMRKTLRRVLSGVWFPAEEVTALTSSSGEASARTSAIASS